MVLVLSFFRGIVKKKYLNVLQALVVCTVEMFGHLCLFRILNDLVEVDLEPLFQSIFGLTYILVATFVVGDAVDQVIVVATRVVF